MCAIGVYMSSDSVSDTLKYQYVKRSQFDYTNDRNLKKFDGILHRLAVLESFVHDVHQAIDDLGSEIEALQLGSKVVIAGKRDALRRKE